MGKEAQSFSFAQGRNAEQFVPLYSACVLGLAYAAAQMGHLHPTNVRNLC